MISIRYKHAKILAQSIYMCRPVEEIAQILNDGVHPTFRFSSSEEEHFRLAHEAECNAILNPRDRFGRLLPKKTQFVPVGTISAEENTEYATCSSSFVGLALHAAAVNDAVGICELLLEADADIYLRDRNQCTALHVAAMYGSVGVMSMLLEADARRTDLPREKSLPFLRDEKDRVALFTAGFHQRMPAVDLLYDVSPYTPRTKKECDHMLNILRYEDRKSVFMSQLLGAEEEEGGVCSSDSESEA